MTVHHSGSFCREKAASCPPGSLADRNPKSRGTRSNQNSRRHRGAAKRRKRIVSRRSFPFVMAGLVQAIHVFDKTGKKDVDARHKADES
jgi:hypothetical protein